MAGAGPVDEAAVKKTIKDLFTGMRQSDGEMVRSVFTEGAILQTIVKTKEGKTVIRTENVDSFAALVSRPYKEIYDERITFETLRIDADLAMVWTPYHFYIGKNFSHCGVNSFQLVKTNGFWKIQYLIDTRRKENCKSPAISNPFTP